MNIFEQSILGETDETVLMESSEENISASLLMAQQVRQSIYIISRELDPIIYNTPEFVETVKQMVLKSKHSRVRILVHDPVRIVKRGHRLVDLALTLSSFIEIRILGKEHATFNEALFVADETGYIHRTQSDRFEGKVNFYDKRTSRLLLHEFNEIWGKSRSDPNLKRALL